MRYRVKAYVQIPLINAHSDVFSKATGLNPYYVYESCADLPELML